MKKHWCRQTYVGILFPLFSIWSCLPMPQSIQEKIPINENFDSVCPSLSKAISPVKTLESPLDCKEIKPVNPKGNQLWIFLGRTDAEAPILWPPDVKSWLIGKDPEAWKDWRWKEKGPRKVRCWMPSPTQRTWVWANSRRYWKTEKAWSAAVHGVTKSQTRLSLPPPIRNTNSIRAVSKPPNQMLWNPHRKELN